MQEKQAQLKKRKIEDLYKVLEQTKDPRDYFEKLVPGLFPGKEAEIPGARPAEEKQPELGLSESDPKFWAWAKSTKGKTVALASQHRSEEGETEEKKAEKRKVVAQLLRESLNAKRERERKAREEAEKDLPKTECAQGSTSSQEELRKDKREEKVEEKEEEVDLDKVDLNELWKTGNFDSEGEYESFSSDSEGYFEAESSAESDVDPVFLPLSAKIKAKPRLQATSKKNPKTVKKAATSESTSQIRRAIQRLPESVKRHPLKLRSRSSLRLLAVTRGVRPEWRPFEKLRDLKGEVGPRYSGSVYHQPTTTKRPGLIDAETGIEHRLTKRGYWLPVLGASSRTGKARSLSAKYKYRAARKAKATAKRKAAAAPPWR